MKIGVVGTGKMGTGFALSLLRAGHEVTVYNRTASKTAKLVEAGALAAATPGECANGDVVFSMLSNDEALRAAVEGDNGLRRNLGEQTVHVSSSTVSVEVVRQLSPGFEGRWLSAPVLGRPDAAERGELSVLAAGPAEALERCRPALQAISRRIFILGDRPEQANAAKLAANFLIAINIESLGEAYALVESHGVAAASFHELLTGTLFDSPVVRNYGSIIAERRFEPAGFALELGLKDVKLGLAAADREAVEMPLAQTLRARFEQAIEQGLSHHDWSAVTELSRKNTVARG